MRLNHFKKKLVEDLVFRNRLIDLSKRIVVAAIWIGMLAVLFDFDHQDPKRFPKTVSGVLHGKSIERTLK